MLTEATKACGGVGGGGGGRRGGGRGGSSKEEGEGAERSGGGWGGGGERRGVARCLGSKHGLVVGDKIIRVSVMGKQDDPIKMGGMV